MANSFYVYIITNWNNRVLYIGFTNDLIRRIYEHKHKLVGGFSKKYNLDKLIYFELYDDPSIAILREKELKGWKRMKKLSLIEKTNPNYDDLYSRLL